MIVLGMHSKFDTLHFGHKIYYGVLVLLLNCSLSQREKLTQPLSRDLVYIMLILNFFKYIQMYARCWLLWT